LTKSRPQKVAESHPDLGTDIETLMALATEIRREERALTDLREIGERLASIGLGAKQCADFVEGLGDARRRRDKCRTVDGADWEAAWCLSDDVRRGWLMLKSGARKRYPKPNVRGSQASPYSEASHPIALRIIDISGVTSDEHRDKRLILEGVT
jgi:hypothetical protein